MKATIFVSQDKEFINKKINNLLEEFKDKNLEIQYYSTQDPSTKRDYKDSDVVLGIAMSSEELGEAEKLKQIFVPYTGLNNFPQDQLAERNINIEGSHAKAKYVAEKALTLLLSTMGRVIHYDNSMRVVPWTRKDIGQWDSLFNKKIGLVGSGHIAQEFIKLAKPFTNDFSTLDRGKKVKNITHFYKSFEELANNTEILIVSLPLNNSTENIINKSVLDNFNGFIVNVGRGAVIEEKAFYNALTNGTIKGAGIDVWYQYPNKDKAFNPSKFDFHKLDNVTMSPHIATDNVEDELAYINDAFEKLRDYISKNI